MTIEAIALVVAVAVYLMLNGGIVGKPSNITEWCVCCGWQPATTTSEGIGHPVCEDCATDDLRNIQARGRNL